MDVSSPDPKEKCWLLVKEPLPSELGDSIKMMWPTVKQHSPKSHNERRELLYILEESIKLRLVQVWVDKRLVAKKLVAKRLAAERLVGGKFVDMKLVGFCLTEICNVEQVNLRYLMVNEDWRRKGIATALFDESVEFAGSERFTTLTLGTKKGSDACYFYDSLRPSTKDSNTHLVKYTWFLSKGLPATHVTEKRKRKPRYHKPHDILKRAAPDLERLAKTGGAELAMACVVTSNKVTFWSNQSTSRYLNPNRVVFDIASLTKIFTNMALQLCVEKGLLTWNDPISKHLSIDPGSDLGQKSIFQVTFDNGLPYMNDATLGPDASPILSMEDLLPVVQNYHRESRGIQTSIEYSNAKSPLLAECIARVTGKPFPIVVKEYILIPLDMNSTCATKDDLDQIPQHRQGPHKRYFDKVHVSAMGFCSTVEDLAKLFKATLAPKQSKWIPQRKNEPQLDLDLFSPAVDYDGHTYSLFGTAFPPGTDIGRMSRNSRFSPTAQRDRTNFYPKPLQCRTGAINGFDSSVFFLPDIKTVILCAASTKNLVDVAYPIAVRVLQELLPDPISPDMARIMPEIKRYQEIALSVDSSPAHLPPLSGSFVCDGLRQQFDFEENEYRVTVSGRVVLKYQWVCTEDAIELVPSPPSLEWNKSWKNRLLEVTREGEGDITGLIRMCWNGIMWKYKRLKK